MQEKYVKDVSTNKENKLLVNKADFLQDFQREAWAKYFKAQGICAVFYSAVESLEIVSNASVQSLTLNLVYFVRFNLDSADP